MADKIDWTSIRKAIAGMFYKCPVATPSAKENPKEKYYNNKYPKKDIVYRGRYVPNTSDAIAIDVRNFFNEYDSDVRKVVEGLKLSGSDDDKALKCFLWIIDKIKYVTDDKKGKRDYWQFGFETIYYKNGDCEDGSILLANMMLLAGIPYWKIRLSVGDVTGGAHAYVTYYCEIKDRWVLPDWCYLVNKDKIVNRKDYKDEENYSAVWFSWNSKYSFTTGLNDKAKEVLEK